MQAQAPASSAPPPPSMVRPNPETVGVANAASLWPSGIVYYDDAGCISGGTCPNLSQALTTFNTDFSPTVQWTKRTTQTTYVVIALSGTGGAGDVNTIGYPQLGGTVNLNCNTDCSVTTLLHEMGHIIGLYHEQTRTDRDSYVSVNYGNVIKGTWTSDFATNMQNQQLLSPYDYASVMQYPPYVDTRNGGPVIETVPAGIPLQGTEGVPGAGNQDYSAGDKEAILRLYGAPPATVTVTSNPVHLQVIIDGSATPCTTPCVESWALNSTHTIGVANGVQEVTGQDIENSSTPATFYYTYGRWSDSTVQSHQITVTPGDGSPAFPATAPAVATYTANFIQLVPYTETVTPGGSGTVSVSPQPQAYQDTQGNPITPDLFVARQEVTLTAAPTSGYNFYEFNAQSPYFWLTGGLSANPKTFFVPDTGNPVAVSAEFSSTPVYTVNVAPADPIANEFSSNLRAWVDGALYYTPQNFSSTYDPTWTVGSTTHTLNIDSPQQPYSLNSEFVFLNWSDGGAQSHGIAALPNTNTSYTATVTPMYQPATNFGGLGPCGGTAAITPASSNGGFYPWGTKLTYTAAPYTTYGWSFGGWTFDLTGTTSPATLTATDETLVYANFNTANAPLTLTSLSPSSVAAGASTFTLTVYGTGFAASSYVVVNGNYPTVTYVNSGELQVQVDSSWVANPGNFDVYVENFPPGSTGCAVFAYDTFAVTASGTGSITPAIQWSPVAEIVSGDAGASVLNATTAPPDIGNFTYSAVLKSGGSPIDITAGTSNLSAGIYTVTANFQPSNPEYTPTAATTTLTVTNETVWITNGTSATLTEMSGVDGFIFSSGSWPSANAAIAIDSGGNVWTAGAGPLLEETSQVGTVQDTIGSGGGLNAPAAIAVDGLSQVWVTNGNNSVSLFSNAGAPISPLTGYTDTSLATPTGIAIDQAGSVWVANKGNNSLTRILGAAAPAAPLSTAAKNNTTGARP